MTFELWDTSAGRVVGAFENERAALDAAYRKLLGGRAAGTLAVRGSPAAPPAEAVAAAERVSLGASLAATATLAFTLLRWAVGR